MGSLALAGNQPALAANSLFYQSVYPSSAPTVESADGVYFTLRNGQRIFDSTGGAAVSAIGHGNERVKSAIIKQLNKFTYAHPGYFQNDPSHELAEILVRSTGGQLSRACLLGPGSEAIEAAMKLARQYFLELNPKAPRTRFIARQSSWHGCTLGTLAVGNLKARKEPFVDVLADNVSHVSPCHPYRDLQEGETVEGYVDRLAEELDAEFHRVGSENVCAFVIEPMVCTALGYVTALPGYLQAMKDVCHCHGALIIFDEVMCGLGRTGYMHAWQYDDVVPDIQVVGKGLAAGYGTISALLIHERVIEGLKHGAASFQHGQTYQCHPLNVVAAVEVQRIIKEKHLVRSARLMGILLGHLLRQALKDHPNVGDVRGRGMFWCVEFVADKTTKKPLDPKLNIARRLRMRGLEKGYDVCLFSSTGCADGWNGDHFLLAPPFTVTPTDVEEIVYRAVRVIDSVFDEIRTKGQV